MDFDSLRGAINERISRRTYEPVPLTDAEADRIRELVADYTPFVADSRLELVTDNGTAFEGLIRSYGLFRGVTNFLVLISTTGDEDSNEKLGYYGELISLAATRLGLGSCFVGGTFDKSAIPVKLGPGERFAACLTLGKVAGPPKGRERLIRDAIHRKTKSVEEMTEGFGTPPAWFEDGVKAAQKAPSAMNRQPVVFRYDSGVISAAVDNPKEFSMLMDLGIAKANFALGAGGGFWEWGNHGHFTREAGAV